MLEIYDVQSPNEPQEIPATISQQQGVIKNERGES